MYVVLPGTQRHQLEHLRELERVVRAKSYVSSHKYYQGRRGRTQLYVLCHAREIVLHGSETLTREFKT